MKEKLPGKPSVLHFTGKASDGYLSSKVNQPHPPWYQLVKEGKSRFTQGTVQDVVEEFNKVQQTGKIDEYIDRVEVLKARLLHA